MKIKYAHVAIHQPIHDVLKALVEEDPSISSIASYLRTLLLKDPKFQAISIRQGQDFTMPTNIRCNSCKRTFKNAHGFNIHLVKISTCKQKKIEW